MSRPHASGSSPTIESEENDDAISKRSVKHDSGVADLEKVTDYAEEKDVISTEQFEGVYIKYV